MKGSAQVTDPEFQDMISRLMAAEKDLTDDFWAVASVQVLAETMAAIKARLTDEELAMLIGVGAVLIRLSRDEAMAGVRAGLAIQRAKHNGGR